jgi:glycosyltransferase involved in cell wall biosynthesis
VLHVNTEKGWRGGETQTLLLIQGLVDRGHHCLLLAPPGSPLEQKARRFGLRVEPLAARSEFDLSSMLALSRIVRDFQPDLIHYHTSRALGLGTLASYLGRRVPSVASRRVSFPLTRNPLAGWKYTHRVDRIIAVSEGIRRVLLDAGVPPSHIEVIHSCVDLERFRKVSDRKTLRRELGYEGGEFVVGTVGHLARHKGHAILVEAARILLSEPVPFRFLLVGEGEEQASLRRQLQESGLEGRFRLAGFVEEVADVLPALDLFVFPSLSGEGSPGAVKEAMACGIPIVATSIAGLDELLRDGMDGWLVPPGDPAALAETILRVASDQSLGIEFGRRSRERVLRFSPERMVEATESLYGKLLEGRGK